MKFIDNMKQFTEDEMIDFVLQKIHYSCNGFYDEECRSEGYLNCRDCVQKMLNREIKE